MARSGSTPVPLPWSLPFPWSHPPHVPMFPCSHGAAAVSVTTGQGLCLLAFKLTHTGAIAPAPHWQRRGPRPASPCSASSTTRARMAHLLLLRRRGPEV
jgi:hypothetical protein